MPVDHTCTRLTSAQKEITKLELRNHDNPSHVLRRRFRALLLECPQTVALAKIVISRATNDYLDHVKTIALRKWRARVKLWGVQSAGTKNLPKH